MNIKNASEKRIEHGQPIAADRFLDILLQGAILEKLELYERPHHKSDSKRILKFLNPVIPVALLSGNLVLFV
jgi:hypothetical protein